MRKIYIILGVILVVVNSLFGLIFEAYEPFNWLMSDVVILLNAGFLQFLVHSRVSDGFKVALSFILPFIGFVMFVISVMLEKEFSNNFMLAVFLTLLSIQVILLLTASVLKSIKE